MRIVVTATVFRIIQMTLLPIGPGAYVLRAEVRSSGNGLVSLGF